MTRTGLRGTLLYACLCLSLVSPAAVGAQFHRLATVGDGADNISAVRGTAQDKRGFIWFGGENGLARYDGQHTVIYQTDPADPRSLSGNYVWALTSDHDGTIWLGTWQGLNRYNATTDDFDRFLHNPGDDSSISSDSITSLTVDQDNNLVVGTENGLNLLNASRTAFQRYYYSPQGHAGHNFVREVFVDSKDQIWIGTDRHGLLRLDRQTGEFTAFVHDPQNASSLVDNDVYAIEEDHLGRLWVGTQNRGLSRMNEDGKTFTHYRHDPNDTRSLINNQVADVLEDRQGNLWVALDRGGIALYEPETDSFRHFTHSAYDPHSLSGNHPRSLFEDRQGDLWVGMFPAGANFLDQSASAFRNYFHKPDDPTSISDSGILCFFEDSQGTLWIGTENGLNAFDRRTGTFTRYFADPEEQLGLQFGAVLTVQEDLSGDLWIGTWSGGLYRFDRQLGTFHNYFPDESDPNSINSEYIWKVLRDDYGVIWAATGTGGLNRYNRETDSFTHFTADAGNPQAIASNRVWTALKDSKGALWLGTLGGLSRFDPRTETFTHFLHDPDDPNSISSNHVVSLFEDSRGRMWAGTRDAGVNILEPGTASFRSLSARDGLPSASVSSIIEDDAGYMWLTAVNGIARVHPDTFAATRYSKSHGLVSQNYSRDATFRDSQGNIYVGGIDGFSVFHPSRLNSASAPPSVAITAFRILNQPVTIGGENGVLQQAISETRDLRLSYEDRMFSFDFAALSYRSPEDHQYAYMLEGFDESWHYVGNRRSATYTSLPAGRYTFRVKAANRDGVWNEQGAAIGVLITPPLWQTSWAYLGYAMAFIGLVYVGNKYKTLHVTSNVYRALSATDPLTGVSNRAGIAHASVELLSPQQIEKGVGLLVIDIDYFKSINDELGHDAGDRILKEFASLVCNGVRSGDRFARWGGEEFVLLCANVGAQGLAALAEKLRKTVENHRFEEGHAPLQLTVSIGTACARAGDDFESLFKRADVALYQAKAGGRNLAVTADCA